MLKQIASKVFIVGSYLWVAVIDMIILLSVFSLCSRVAQVFDASDSMAFFVGCVGSIISFAHLHFRHRMRHFGQKKKYCMLCGDDKWKPVCQNCLDMCSGENHQCHNNSECQCE